GLGLHAVAIELVASRGDLDPGRNLEGLFEPLEFRRVVRLVVVALLRLEIDRRHENAPGLRLAGEVGRQARKQLEEELANAAEKAAFGPRLIGGAGGVFANIPARKKSQRRIERVAELVHRGLDIPEIVRVLSLDAPAFLRARSD